MLFIALWQYFLFLPVRTFTTGNIRGWREYIGAVYCGQVARTKDLLAELPVICHYR